MGAYVCEECFGKWGMEPLRPLRCAVACCEVCGPLRGDWTTKQLAWTNEVTRAGEPTLIGGPGRTMEEQLLARKTVPPAPAEEGK